MSNNTQIREINFPEINQEKLGEGSLPKEETVSKIRDIVKFLIEVRALKRTSFLVQSTLDKAKEISLRLDEKVEQFPQLKGVVQNLFGQLVKKMAEEKGDSKTLFNRLDLLVEEAEYYGVLQEWTEEKLDKVPYGLKRDFLVRLRSGKDQFRFFLPSNWRNQVHKRTALVLRDLAIKAKNTWMDEKGIPREKSDTNPAPTAEPQTPPETLTPPAEPPAPPAKPHKKDKPPIPKTPRDKAGKVVKAAKAKDREKDDTADVRDVIKTGKISLADNPKALDSLKK